MIPIMDYILGIINQRQSFISTRHRLVLPLHGSSYPSHRRGMIQPFTTVLRQAFSSILAHESSYPVFRLHVNNLSFSCNSPLEFAYPESRGCLRSKRSRVVINDSESRLAYS